MAKHARSRSSRPAASRPAASRPVASRPVASRPAVCQSRAHVITPGDRRCASAKPAPSAGKAARRPTMIGVIINRADFERLRAAGSTAYTAYGDYLHDIEQLLAGLGRDGVEVRGRAFSPADFEEYCEREGLSPTDDGSHLAYTADPAAEEEWVGWEGEPLPYFLQRLDRAHEHGGVRRRLDRMLAETAEAALTGNFPEPLLRIAYARGAEALRGFLLGAGEGAFTAVCSIFAPELPVFAWADLRLEPDGVLRVDDEDLDLLCEVLCVGYALNLPGAFSLSGVCSVRGEVGWEWTFDGESFLRM